MQELKSCPFCGEGNSIVDAVNDTYGKWMVACGACGASSGKARNRSVVVDHWNVRHEADIVEAMRCEYVRGYTDGINGVVTQKDETAEQPVDWLRAFKVAKDGIEMPLYTTTYNPFIEMSIDCESYAEGWFRKGFEANTHKSHELDMEHIAHDHTKAKLKATEEAYAALLAIPVRDGFDVSYQVRMNEHGEVEIRNPKYIGSNDEVTHDS